LFGIWLTEHCSLQKLDVSGNKFGLSGVERLLQSIDVCHLLSINLSATVGPGHAPQLLKQLTKLLLHSVRISSCLNFALAFLDCFLFLLGVIFIYLCIYFICVGGGSMFPGCPSAAFVRLSGQISHENLKQFW